MLKSPNWATLEYAKASFDNNTKSHRDPHLDFLISLDTEKILGNKLTVLARWRHGDDTLFYGIQEKEENYDNLHRFVKMTTPLFLQEVLSAVSSGLTTAIQESVKSKIKDIALNTEYLLLRLNINPLDK